MLLHKLLKHIYEHEVELRGNAYRTEKLRFVFNPKAIRQQEGSYYYYGKHALVRIWADLC